MTAFTTPQQITDALRDRIRDRLLNQAYRQAEAAQEYVRTDKRPRGGFAPLLAVETDRYSQTVRFVNIDFRTIQRITEISVKNATDLLEDRVNRNVAETESLFDVTLSIENADLIEGVISGETAQGERFHIDVQMLWNYRYGENSANGVLTVYPQFRGTRQGAPLAGKPQQSTATAAKEAAKAERLAAKAARRAELRAKFAKAPERLARQCEKDIRDWRVDHPTAAQWAFIRDTARALTEQQLDEMFDQGARTSGDIESKLERQFRALATA